MNIVIVNYILGYYSKDKLKSFIAVKSKEFLRLVFRRLKPNLNLYLTDNKQNMYSCDLARKSSASIYKGNVINCFEVIVLSKSNSIYSFNKVIAIGDDREISIFDLFKSKVIKIVPTIDKEEIFSIKAIAKDKQYLSCIDGKNSIFVWDMLSITNTSTQSNLIYYLRAYDPIIGSIRIVQALFVQWSNSIFLLCDNSICGSTMIEIDPYQSKEKSVKWQCELESVIKDSICYQDEKFIFSTNEVFISKIAVWSIQNEGEQAQNKLTEEFCLHSDEMSAFCFLVKLDEEYFVAARNSKLFLFSYAKKNLIKSFVLRTVIHDMSYDENDKIFAFAFKSKKKYTISLRGVFEANDFDSLDFNAASQYLFISFA